MRQGEAVDGIWLLLSGRVKLSRNISGKEQVFHAQTVGRIVGLLALSGPQWQHRHCWMSQEVCSQVLVKRCRTPQPDLEDWHVCTCISLIRSQASSQGGCSSLTDQ